MLPSGIIMGLFHYAVRGFEMCLSISLTKWQMIIYPLTITLHKAQYVFYAYCRWDHWLVIKYGFVPTDPYFVCYIRY